MNRAFAKASNNILDAAEKFYVEFEDDLGNITKGFVDTRFNRRPIARDVYSQALSYTRAATAAVTKGQGILVSRAGRDASRLVGAAHEVALRQSFTVVDLRPRQVDLLVGRLSNGVALAKRLTPLSKAMQAAVNQELQTALVNAVPRREMREILSARLKQALSKGQQVGHTEMLKSYREAQRIQYRANSIDRGGLVRGVRRFARRDSRTCMACIAQDGAFYELGSTFPTHVNCRCGFIPEVIGGNPLIQGRVTAQEWFTQLTPRRQLRILGPGKKQLWDMGRLPFDKWVAVDKSRVWGSSEREPSIREILAGKSGPGIGVDIP